jgi:pyruvate kinase
MLNSEAARSAQLDALIEQLVEIRRGIGEFEQVWEKTCSDVHPSYHKSARNLAHYIALRRRDIRSLQEQLAELGLSSLGRAEAHVMATLDSVLAAIHGLAGRPWRAAPSALAFREGNKLLREHTDVLLGSAPANRAVRIMVTMPTEAASDYALVRELLARGMDCLRINCAYDGPEEWAAMAAHVAQARRELDRPCRISMDVAGPKLRVGPLEPGPEVLKLRPRRDALGRVIAPARFRLAQTTSSDPSIPSIPVASGDLAALRVGERIDFTDIRGSKRQARVSACSAIGPELECDRTCYLGSGLELHSPHGGVIRLGRLPAIEHSIALRKGDSLVLVEGLALGREAELDEQGRVLRPAEIGCTLPQIVRDVHEGEQIWFDDGRIGGTITRVFGGTATIEITHAAPVGSKLRANKGINLPDSDLHISSLTPKDYRDLESVVRHADIVGMSFVRTPADVDLLDAALARLGRRDIGVVLKIETRKAFDNLPDLMLAAMRRHAAGVMIARGDLAVECGFERLAELQEEILWICEAAHMPVIWATQVLESLAKTGLPSRAEITDAAMGERAECVMLNKGPHLADAVGALDDILVRMTHHQVKKSPMLRRLRRW